MGKRRVRAMQETLRRRVESCRSTSTHMTCQEIVNHLRSTYGSDYQRIKNKTLMRLVGKALQSTANAPPLSDSASETVSMSEGSDDEDTPPSMSGSASASAVLMPTETSETVLMSEESVTGRARAVLMLEEEDEDDDIPPSMSGSAIAVPIFDLLKENLRESYKETTRKKVELEVDNSSTVNEAEAEGESKSATETLVHEAPQSTATGLLKNVEMEVELEGESKSATEALVHEAPQSTATGFDLLKNVEMEVELEGESKSAREQFEGSVSKSGFQDLGGMNEVLYKLRTEVLLLLNQPHAVRRLGLKEGAHGILLHGPPGCGKTTLAHAIANEYEFPFYHINATDLGSSLENIRALFSEAYRDAPSVLFIDEVDAIASRRDNLSLATDRQIVSQLLTCMDKPVPDKNSLLLIGSTNRLDAIDPAFRRPGRFSEEISIDIPDEAARVQILSVLTRSLSIKLPLSYEKIARSTPGFTGADLANLVEKAGVLAMNRIVDEKYSMSDFPEGWWMLPWSPTEVDKLAYQMSDFEEAVKLVHPSTREGFSPIPYVQWEDVVGHDSLRKVFDKFIIQRIKHPELLGAENLESGFLLYGPPGCGKTLIVKAVANAAGANFIYIKGPELLNKDVGERELAVQTLFSRAATFAPCILFIDEVDAVTTKRGEDGGQVTGTLLSQLMIELDEAAQQKGVFVIGATNRFNVIDPAILRSGRLGKQLYVPLPSPEDRGLILKVLARDIPIDSGVDLDVIGRMQACENMSGADLKALMNEAALAAHREELASINTHHFEVAVSLVRPSVSKEASTR